jgi:MFS family permease
VPEPRTTTAPPARQATAILAIICISYFMVILDNSIIFTGLPRIEAAMHFSPAGLTWVQDACTLVFGGLLLLGARAGAIAGRRRMFTAGLVLFGLASLLAGAAPAAYSAVAGIGASLGLVIGGVLAGEVSWRAGFFLNVPVGLLMVVAARRCSSSARLAPFLPSARSSAARPFIAARSSALKPADPVPEVFAGISGLLSRSGLG